VFLYLMVWTELDFYQRVMLYRTKIALFNKMKVFRCQVLSPFKRKNKIRKLRLSKKLELVILKILFKIKQLAQQIYKIISNLNSLQLVKIKSKINNNNNKINNNNLKIIKKPKTNRWIMELKHPKLMISITWMIWDQRKTTTLWNRTLLSIKST